ncbi:hypothetical protein [Vibrio owensii]|uniref:hypothetical protein n=1 Tax=Vibrio owensii TaxID=696485 RepID=UPI0018F1FAB2|nr:hypothetical protein [Vibrio owensii]
MKKLNVQISKSGVDAVSDYEVEGWYNDALCSDDGATVKVATSLMFSRLRAAVRFKEIAPFSFEFEGGTYTICQETAKVLPNWPEDFFNHSGLVMFQVMTGRQPPEGAF